MVLAPEWSSSRPAGPASGSGRVQALSNARLREMNRPSLKIGRCSDRSEPAHIFSLADHAAANHDDSDRQSSRYE